MLKNQPISSVLLPSASKTVPLLMKPKVEIPKFKALFKMIKKSEYISSISSRPTDPVSKLSLNRDCIDSNQPISAPDLLLKKQLKQSQSKQEISSANLDPKTQRIITYRNLLKTTRERFKRNLIDYMNKKKDDKMARNTSYRFPALPNSRSTHRTAETNEDDEEKLHIYGYHDNFQTSSSNSKSLPNLGNYYYTFNKRKNDSNDENDLKLPNLPLRVQEPFTTERSLREDSIFWSKYKRTISRQMRTTDGMPAHDGGMRTTNNYYGRIDSISEDNEYFMDKKFTKPKFVQSALFNYDSQVARYKTPMSERRMRKANDENGSISSDAVLGTLTHRMSEVSVKN